MSRQSKRRRDAKRAAEAKARRRRTTAKTRRKPAKHDELSSLFESSTVDVSVIRSESNRTYPDGENIPLTDRVVLERQSGVSIEDAIAIAEEFEAAIKRGEFPDGSRVTVMDNSWQMG